MTTLSPQSLELAETELQNAIREGDVASLDELLDQNVIFVGPDGAEVDKEADLAAHRSGDMRFESVTELARATRQFGTAGTTRVRLHLVGTTKGAPFDATLVYTRTWQWAEARWRVVQAQGAVVPAHPQLAGRVPIPSVLVERAPTNRGASR